MQCMGSLAPLGSALCPSTCNVKHAVPTTLSARGVAVQGRAIGRRGAAAQAAAGTAPRAADPVPKFGVHGLVWEGGWSREEATRVISGTAAAGYDLVEVPMVDPDSIDAAHTRDLLQQHGITASGSTGLQPDQDISSESEEIRREGLRVLKIALQKCSEIGATQFVGVNYGAMTKYAQPASKEQWQHCVTSLKELAVVAADLGLEYGLEVVNRYETNLINTASRAMDLVGDVGAPNVVVHLDSYHVNIEERSMEAAVAVCGDKLRYIHVGESHRGYLGTGSIDFAKFFAPLARAGYRGPLTFESFSSAVVSPLMSNGLCVWRDLWDDSEDLARHARQYMGAQWHAAAVAARPERAVRS
mmetsp:Transcript_15183/g.45782  ORF Transcript_15183/g.45782 Transcript_15183/m.45782 type:complete len:358 (+) Transcript_15183:125-1198(+)